MILFGSAFALGRNICDRSLATSVTYRPIEVVLHQPIRRPVSDPDEIILRDGVGEDGGVVTGRPHRQELSVLIEHLHAVMLTIGDESRRSRLMPIRVAAFLCVLAVVLVRPILADRQGSGRGQGQGAAAQAPPPTDERVRVKTGMIMRWYKNENNGWIHDSMLEVVKAGEK
jgi:hypothetical protein